MNLYDYNEISHELNLASRILTKEEECLSFSLEWYLSVLSEGYETTARNFSDSLTEHKDALLHIGAVKNAEHLEKLREFVSSVDTITTPQADEDELETEILQKIDEAILRVKSSTV